MRTSATPSPLCWHGVDQTSEIGGAGKVVEPNNTES
jgi:hypothetical protein